MFFIVFLSLFLCRIRGLRYNFVDKYFFITGKRMNTKKAKILSESQTKRVAAFLSASRNADRDLTIFLLSVKAGLRAKEIAGLTWKMVIDDSGVVGDVIDLTNSVSKGSRSGRVIPLNPSLKKSLERLYELESVRWGFDVDKNVVRTERSEKTTPQVIVNKFADWYRRVGLVGCSSHSGRRTMITKAARKIGSVGGSLNDVRLLAGHASLQTTARYIEYETDAQRKVMSLL
jgi:integrase/recombinase XerD